MKPTTILVDFENVQPSAADIGLVRGEQLRLWIFRGPGQKKYSADVAEAWQPLGDSVRFIHCAKAGRNALDMHIAFELGRLLAGNASVRCAVVSKDTDYDPLLQYIRSLGAEATRVSSIKAALGGAADRHIAKQPVAKQPKAKPAPPARKAAPAKKTRAAAVKAETAKPAPVAKKPAKAPQATALADELIDKATKHLLEHPKSRPAKRKALEKNIESVLRKKIDAKEVPALVDALEQCGVITMTGNKIAYPLWAERGK